MSKKISYKGKIQMGEQDKIYLKTIKGKVGYKIIKFQLMPITPGAQDNEAVSKIYTKDQTNLVDGTVDFTDSELIAAAYYKEEKSTANTVESVIIFDNTTVNQNIFITMHDARGETNSMNYYIELEAMSLNDLEATQLTLKNIRTITS
jgi:hypothetical protein